MSVQQVLQELESIGSEQTRKTYRRHGAGQDVYGVSYASLEKLRKRIKVDQALAEGLWQSGNHDARVLATMIADPKKVSEAVVDGWAADVTYYTLTDALATFVARTPYARKKLEQWYVSDDEWLGRLGWKILAHLALKGTDLPDSYFESFLDVVEAEIHGRKNYVRDAMNGGLIAIGVRSPALEPRALAVAAKIGKVEVDHGDTDCKTPDAAAYIRKTLDRKRK